MRYYQLGKGLLKRETLLGFLELSPHVNLWSQKTISTGTCFWYLFAIIVDHHHMSSSKRFSIALYCVLIMPAICITSQHTEAF